jgi:hypothetical protein
MIEQKWLTRAKETYKFHRIRVLADEDWTLTQTAKALHRSLGGICEDLLIAKGLKNYEPQIEKFDYARECIEFLRAKQKEEDLKEIE